MCVYIKGQYLLLLFILNSMDLLIDITRLTDKKKEIMKMSNGKESRDFSIEDSFECPKGTPNLICIVYMLRMMNDHLFFFFTKSVGVSIYRASNLKVKK